jgi:hypothetical protein
MILAPERHRADRPMDRPRPAAELYGWKTQLGRYGRWATAICASS